MFWVVCLILYYRAGSFTLMNKTVLELAKTLTNVDNILAYSKLEISLMSFKHNKIDDNDIKVSKKIISFYNECKIQEKNSQLAKVLGPSELWADVLKRHQAKVINCCLKNDSVELSNILKNLFRSSSIMGMTYPDAYNIPGSKIYRNVRSKARLVRSISGYLEKIQKNTNKELTHKLLEIINTEIGNPIIQNVGKHRVAFEMVYYVLMLLDLDMLIPLERFHGKSIMDLGSGLGLLNLILLKYLKDVEITFVDLPENLVHSAWLAEMLCPEVPIQYGITDVKAQMGQSRINLIPYYQIDKIQSNSASLFINTFSLPEMDFKSSQEYIKQIHRILMQEGHFFSINRKETVHNKGFTNYTMTGIQDILKDFGEFSKYKELKLEDSLSQNNDFMFPQGNIEVALYNKCAKENNNQ